MTLRKIVLSVGAAVALIGVPLATASSASADERCYERHCSVGPFATFEECNAVKNEYAQQYVILANCAQPGSSSQPWFFAYQKPLAG